MCDHVCGSQDNFVGIDLEIIELESIVIETTQKHRIDSSIDGVVLPEIEVEKRKS